MAGIPVFSKNVMMLGETKGNKKRKPNKKRRPAFDLNAGKPLFGKSGGGMNVFR